MLNANLDGLVSSGLNGFQLALKNFERFRSSSEAFVAWYVALHFFQEKELNDKLWKLTFKNYDTAKLGIVVAFSQLSDTDFNSLQNQWLDSKDELKTALILQILSQRVIHLNFNIHSKIWDLLPKYLDSSSIHIKSAALELIGYWRKNVKSNNFVQDLHSSDFPISYSALLAQLRCAPRSFSQDKISLSLAVTEKLFATTQNTKGYLQLQQLDALERLTLTLAHCAKINEFDFTPWIQKQSLTNQALFIACHGNINYVNCLTNLFDNETASSVAFWGFCFLTGLNHLDPNFHLPHTPKNTKLNLESEGTGFGSGLPKPDKNKVLTWWSKNKPKFDLNRRYLLGLVVTDKYAENLFVDFTQPQIVRYCAQMHLLVSNPNISFRGNKHPRFGIDLINMKPNGVYA